MLLQATTAAQSLDEMDFERGIWNAALYNDLDRVKVLLRHTSPNIIDKSGYTALHYAARSGHLLVCQILLSNGADVDAKTKAGGVTPLMRAVTAGHEDVVKMLIDHGADLSIMDNDGNNSIHRAVLSGQISIATILLHKRPDLQNMKNGKNLSLTEIALNKGIILPS
ncbi:ankyrin repeat domain-containing protein 39-like [Ctenocephalides felis]|uniref:ankyrin repeat domain-containing protein 39-like n=1 Tax=Ctenocephalides felis TaxID=7515 RepID=UPI000E6E17E9|nr:ankyrin repeat domain-containing protein 39-like [Ctenocephalides felis]